MSAVASNNRAASASFLLMLMVTSSWCLLASATPAANNASPLESMLGGRLAGRLQALTSCLDKHGNNLNILLQNVTLPDDLEAQLQQVALTFGIARAALQEALQGVLTLPPTLLTPQALGALEGILHQLEAKMATFVKKLQNPSPAGSCFDTLKADLSGGISDLTSEIVSLASGVSVDPPQDLVTALQNMRDAVNQVDPCAPGLEDLRSNGQGAIDEVGEFVASIQ